MTDVLLEAQGVEAEYGRLPVLRGMSIQVRERESVGLIGPNGHGKSTFLRVLSGLHHPSAGSIRFKGQSIVGLSPDKVIGLGLVQVPQGTKLFPRCTVAETLRLGAYTKRARVDYRTRLKNVYELFPVLYERRGQLCGTLSGGERQMVAISVGLMANPELLMLDEPTLGLAPKAKGIVQAKIEQIHTSGVALIIIDGDIDFVFSLTDRWYGVELGRTSSESQTVGLLGKEEIVEMYFRGGHVRI